MNARIQSQLDQYAAHIATIVRRHGWFIQYVGGPCSCQGDDCRQAEGPPFAYTVGLFGLGHPELLIFGVPPDLAGLILNTLGERIRDGQSILPGQLVTLDEWPHRILPEEVPNPGEIAIQANAFYQRPSEVSVPILQLSYDDRDGRFPGEASYAAPEMQPRPGTFQA